MLPLLDKSQPSELAAIDVALRRIGGCPTYLLTDNEKTVTVEHVAGIPVRNPGAVAFAPHYGLTIATCQPDPRVQALAGALCVTLCAVTGITNRSLSALMTGLLSAPYSMAQASYDLARLRRNGLIARRTHASTCDLTSDGLRFAIFYTKIHDRDLKPLFATGQPQTPPPLRDALHTIDQHIDSRLTVARLRKAA